MEELSNKLRKFKINLSGVKRKAVAVITTQCQHCFKVWDDQIYDPGTHRIICPHCHQIQYDSNGFPARIDDMDLDALKQWGLSRDIAANGMLGGSHIQPSRKSKIMTWEEFEAIYGKQNL